MTTFQLPKWFDLHTHFRQDELLKPMLAQHLAMGCAGALAMPNTKPPVSKVHTADSGEGWSIEKYKVDLLQNGADQFEDLIIPLYLTAATTPKDIEAGAKSGILRACKYYPPHGTTNSEHGAPFEHFIQNGVFAAMAEHNIPLCIHGEEHGLGGETYFDRKTNAEEIFYQTRLPQAVEKLPNLKIICEHITTKIAADFVRSSGPNIAATITPQHLIYTVGDLLQGFKYHLYCLPLVKFEEDRAALRQAATSPQNTKFFAGTDSAPHTQKATACGCAAGCYTGGIAPQLYAMGFEAAGLDLSKPENQETFKKFLCTNGPNFYGIPVSQKTFTLTKQPQSVEKIATPAGPITPLPLGLEKQDLDSTTIPWRIED